MMTSQVSNGRLRKSLGDEIERLHSILDGLADNLSEAVAGAVKDAVGTAVQLALQGVLVEVLTNPELLQQLRGVVNLAPSAPQTAPQPAPSTRPTLLARVWDKVKAFAALGFSQACGFGVAARAEARQAVEKAAAVGGKIASCWRVARYLRVPVLTAAVVGGATGVVAYLGGPHVAACLGWLGGFIAALAVQAGVALRRLTRAAMTVPTGAACD